MAMVSGDAVLLMHEQSVDEIADYEGRRHPRALRTFNPKSTTPKLFDSPVGIYLGMQYITFRDHRSPTGVKRPCHMFLFNSISVILDPRDVSVIGRQSEETP